MPRLSVVVPHISTDAALEQTLLSLLENRDRNCEVIVAHRNDYNDPYGLDGDEVLMVGTDQGSPTQMINQALESATGSIVQIMLPGTTASPCWYHDVLDAFEDYQVGAVATAIHAEELGTAVVGLRAKQLPRHQLVNVREQSESVYPILNGGYVRKKLLTCMNGLYPCDSLTAAEAELASVLQALGVEVQRYDEVTLQCASLATTENGYAEGQQLAKFARAYALLSQSPITIDSMPVRMGKLAASILNPNMVSHRLGWTLGLQDASLATPIRNRFEQAQQKWNDYLEYVESQRRHDSYRRAA